MKLKTFLKILILLIPLYARASTPVNDIYVVFFIIDGAPQNFVYKAIEEGDLAVLKKYFWEEGAHADRAVTTFPSASMPAYQSFITGLFAGHSGVPYLQRFDRDKRKVVDYLGTRGHRNVNEDLTSSATIFEKLGDVSTAAIYSELSRGAKIVRPRVPLGALVDVFITHREENVDVRAFREVEKLFKGSNPPRFTLVGLYSNDVIQHKEGTKSGRATEVLKQFDLYLGKFIDNLRARGLFDKTYIIVASDHGTHDIDRKVDIGSLLKKAGLKKKDVIAIARGVASAHLYFKGDGGWTDRPTLERLKNYPKKDGGTADVITLLRGSEDISLVVARNGDKVEIFSKDGHGTISHSNLGSMSRYGYTFDAEDPLGLASDPALKKMLTGKLFDMHTWLIKTVEKNFPDAVVQLGQIFDDGRAGDIFVIAKSGGFFKVKKATHGSIIAEDMIIPVLIRGPGISPAKFGPVRSVDLYPTILSWFGLETTSRGRDGMAF